MAAEAERPGERAELAADAASTATRLADAAVETVAYSDLFDYPLTAPEIHRYLAGASATRRAVEELLADSRQLSHRLERVGDYYTLPGRGAIVAIRQRRAAAAAALWRRALYYGARIAALPFVRMVAVTGALAVDNSDPDDDLDYLIVTEPGRLWLCRAIIIGLVRLAQRRGDVICPNYLLSERALVLDSRSLYTAREVAQMVPLTGLAVYQRLRQLNDWVEIYLPNAAGAPRAIGLPQPQPSRLRLAAEAILRTPPVGVLEQWEMRRKIHKLIAEHAASASSDEIGFGPDYCKGHFGGYGGKTLAAFQQRSGVS